MGRGAALQRAGVAHCEVVARAARVLVMDKGRFAVRDVEVGEATLQVEERKIWCAGVARRESRGKERPSEGKASSWVGWVGGAGAT